jgi:hypothetical protein
MERTEIEPTPEALNAIHDALGALVFALTMQMPKERRAAFAQQLARAAQKKTFGGAILAGTILLDFATAADFAAKN